MINEIIYWELYALVVSFFNGVLLAWIYDNIWLSDELYGIKQLLL